LRERTGAKFAEFRLTKKRKIFWWGENQMPMPQLWAVPTLFRAHRCTRDFEEFLGWLGRWIGTPIVSEVDLKPTNQVSWHLHERSPSTEQTRSEDHDPTLVLGNITLQTGLTFTLEKRPVRILFVERTQ
jgi:Protein of unknown function (DUF3738)